LQILILKEFLLCRCCTALTAEEMFAKQMHQETDAEKEVIDLKRMQVR
jgi:hypothetical protein